jgi:hypothetical protein
MNKSDNIIESLFEEFCEQDFSKEQLENLFAGKEDESLFKIFGKIINKGYRDHIEFGELKEDWLKKHKTTKLVKMSDSKFADTDSLNDENAREILLNVMTLLFKRLREYQFLTGESGNVKPEDIDKKLFPSPRKPKILPDATFEIDKWDDLLIQIQDGNEKVTFRKIYDGKPSLKDKFSMRYEELGFKQPSVEFLKICATSNNSGSFAYSKRKVKSRVDILLKNLFNMKDMSIVTHPKKKGCYIPLFKIWHYDKDANSIYGHIHGREFATLPDNI